MPMCSVCIVYFQPVGSQIHLVDVIQLAAVGKAEEI